MSNDASKTLSPEMLQAGHTAYLRWRDEVTSAELVGKVFDAMHAARSASKARRPNRQYEAMTRLVCGDFVVRVWTTTSKMVSGPDAYVVNQLLAVKDDTRDNLAACLDGIERIAAYEILDLYGNGSVIYPDWY